VAHRSAYEFFSGLDTQSRPRWSDQIGARAPIFSDPSGTQRVSMSFNAALGRYFLVTPHALGTRASTMSRWNA
jgi:hypothetical protein